MLVTAFDTVHSYYIMVSLMYIKPICSCAEFGFGLVWSIQGFGFCEGLNFGHSHSDVTIYFMSFCSVYNGESMTVSYEMLTVSKWMIRGQTHSKTVNSWTDQCMY